ncbi:1-aminocyclopropane-1-carboxylate deaminase/D-cysteine desulfhydrase [Marinobacterium nitratireducens]|nr:pyridoxal-phosphate dependent enzyme [Marinobacterium nitratireducens]
MINIPWPGVSGAPARLQPLLLPLYRQAGIEVSLLRLDELHSQVSGNKLFKLKYHLEQAMSAGYRRVISFGGAFSNHLHALAFAGRVMGLETIGVVRGEPGYADNPTLRDAADWGMRLHFVDRRTYRCKQTPEVADRLRDRFGDCYIIAEGGAGPPALQGCGEIFDAFPAGALAGTGLVGLAVGTGSTLAGLVAARPEHCRLLGFPVLRGGDFLYRDIASQLREAGLADSAGWQLQLDAHEGGYGRVSLQLAAFLHAFEQETGICLDPVYTGKLLLGFNRLVVSGGIAAGTRVVLIHTGGLQGLRGMAKTLYDRRSAFRGALPL